MSDSVYAYEDTEGETHTIVRLNDEILIVNTFRGRTYAYVSHTDEQGNIVFTNV